ncbi:MAG: MFS transporter [Methanomassiliicoccales archaeon]|nr:MFS transporter [Methanomassiliicoccales archaeon]
MTGEAEQLKGRSPAGIAVILFLTTLAAYIARVNLSVALPFISSDYGWTDAEKGLYGGLLLGIFLVGYGVSNVILSPLVDRFGPRKSMMVAVAVFSLLTFLTGLVGLIFFAFIAARLFLGLSQGILFPSASKVTQAWFEPCDRSKVNSLHLSSMHISNLLVPIFLIPLILVVGWAASFFAVAFITALVLIPLLLYLRDSPIAGTKVESKPIRDVIRDAKAGLRSALRIKGILTLSAADAAGNLVWWGISLWLPTYLIVAKGMSVEQIVLVASLPYLGGVAGLFLGSWISDRTGKRVLVTTAFQLVAVLFIFLLVGANDETMIIIILAAIFFSISILPPNCFTLLQGIAPCELMGSATGIMNGLSVGLGVFGPMILGLAVAATGSYDIGLYIMAGLQVVSAAIMMMFRKHERVEKPVCADDVCGTE